MGACSQDTRGEYPSPLLHFPPVSSLNLKLIKPNQTTGLCHAVLFFFIIYVYDKKQEAIDLAKHAYPELRSVRRDRITFHTTGKSSIACITPAAWQLVVRRLPPYHVVDVRIRDPIEAPEGEADDAELPEYYPYMAASYTIAREKEQQQGQEQPPSAKAAENGGSRLRRMMSSVRVCSRE